MINDISCSLIFLTLFLSNALQNSRSPYPLNHFGRRFVVDL